MAGILSQTPDLFFPFSRKGDLTDVNEEVTLDFARTSEANYVDAGRTIRTAVANEARFDHDPVTGQPLGLLIEGARTNTCLQSTDLTNAPWTNNGTILTVTPGIIGPTGNPDAFRLTSGQANGVRRQIVSGEPTVDHTNSYWIKRVTGTGPIRVYDGAGVGTNVVPVTNQWTRISLTNPSTGGSTAIGFNIDIDGDEIDVWNPQREEGAFGTSDIPTTATSVTRAPDNVSTDDVSWYTQDGPGTFYSHHSIYDVSAGSQRPFDLSALTSSLLFLLTVSTPIWRFQTVVGNACVLDGGVSTDGVLGHYAAGLATNDAASYFNGLQVATDTLCDTVGGVNRLNVGKRANNTVWMYGHIADLAYFAERLSNGALEVLTLNGLPYGGSKNYLAVMRRKLDRPPTKRVYPKPKRGLFR